MTIEQVLAELDGLPLTRDPLQQVAVVPRLAAVLGQLEAFERDDWPPAVAGALLHTIDRMLPLFDDAEFAWDVPGETSKLPPNHYQVDDLVGTLLEETLPGAPGYAEALVALVQRNPQAWNVARLVELARRHPTGRIGATDLHDVIDRLKQLPQPQSAARAARQFRKRRRE